MEEYGTIVETRGNKALVKIIRNSACSKCEKKCGLAKSHDQDELVVEVENRLNAKKGEEIVLEMTETNMVMAALIIYLFPLLAMISGYFLGTWFSRYLDLSTEITGIIGTVIFLILSFILIKIINPVLERKRGFKPLMKNIHRNLTKT